MGELYGRAARVVLHELEITGLDIAFRVSKTLLTPDPDTLELTIWNLSEDHRAGLQNQTDVPVRLEAGYIGSKALSAGTAAALDAAGFVAGTGLPLLFGGDLRDVHSYQEEDGSWMTVLSSGDGDKAKRRRVNKAFGPGTPLRFAIEQVATELGLGLGALPLAVQNAKLFDGGQQFAAGVVLSGNGFKQLTRLLTSMGYRWSVQDGEIVVHTFGGSAVLLTPDTGLVSSPVPQNDGRVTATSLLQPDINPGRQVEIASKHVRGVYAVESVTHEGDLGGWYTNIIARPL
jgi:hypothetical protein